MKKHFKYLSYVLRHKFWVGYYCFKKGLILRGIFHDWSKFLPDEWFPYANYFYGKKGSLHRAARNEQAGYYKPYKTDDQKFDFAWLKHQKRNNHHWQWWALPEDSGGIYALPMKKKAIIEMICDWRGAGRAQGYGDNTIEWYNANKNKMKLHHLTRQAVERKLTAIYGYEAMKDTVTYISADSNFDKEKV